MTDEVVELFGVPEIIADGVAKVHMIGGIIRLCFWKYDQTESGLYKVCAGKLFITKEGLIASRPQISAALDSQMSPIGIQIGQMTAH